MKKLSLLFAGLAVLVACTGFAMAAVLPNATLETNGISSTTVVECDGVVLSTATYSSEQSNQVLNGAPLAAKEVYSSGAYISNYVGLNGKTSFVKTIDTNTKNQVLNGQNIAVSTELTYEGGEGGFATGTESIAQFNAGQAGTKTGDATLCPFTQTKDTQIPPFNEQVEIGSRFMLYDGDVYTTAGATTIGSTADVPSQTEYTFDAAGNGMANVYMKVSAQDARGDGKTLVIPEKVIPAVKDKCGKVIIPEKTIPAVYSPAPSSEIHYSENTMALGSFIISKALGYSSGIV
jgi:hypothetical protein